VTQGRAEAREFTPRSPAAEPSRELLEAFAAAFFEGARAALTTTTNRRVEVRGAGVEPVAPAEFHARLPLPWVAVELRFVRGLAGTCWLVLGREDALALARAVAGGDEAVELGPAHEEVVREAVNQMGSAAAASLVGVVARSLALAPAMVTVVNEPERVPAGLAEGAGRLWLARAQVAGEQGLAFGLVLVLGAELVQELAGVGAEVPESETPAPANHEPVAPGRLALILDVTLPVTVELGRARMQIQDILKLAPGSVIELEKAAGDPVDLLINGRPIAKGEVVVVDENFGVRLTSIVTAAERLRTLR
jgi:flagellar motor switch protein FliN/FliY